ncbi:hypothetical protein pEaSNUABM14_00114 [Erwinia phage pEa_SNUABM_14]|uniref:Tail fiber protein n=1 Tax=Erwinia phage pEa_SNUABM_7 TaxID=2866695 RepID=A0AAE8BP36_9CAUD|nr:tail fiber protein [Erwinia phage pEa_SNUABM_7]QYW03415.1 hypothetical protein pEaSNUABM34_00113 [Erwinia phage pEa_SNUABM_34]QYW03757.1 hypothetical protein pEaSNUABM45_00114 [Erwinia phage pEa_SNUABM_45]QYW04439.1 hypothetical protein pEaSNUABM14_00114 [Erwinia phage pEa_SNUABM_14]QYW05128.1 hypothetical protein pEaSNUABM21_00114 [Erwinia phage pEa_SNUABM_21]QYW04783.1 hypothetical protein pEaSNUABM7_00115 [Erwinia phage pEa_SNUABM_7]
MVEKVDISLLKTNASGKVVATQGGVSVDVAEDETTLQGAFDQLTGVLSINIPSIGKLAISGLPTIYSIGYGPEGGVGASGRDGIDGLMGSDGKRGTDGCVGPRGIDGLPGKQGYVGIRGPAGPTGATGPTGAPGNPGVVAVFVQDTDPAQDQEVPAGAIWVRP